MASRSLIILIVLLAFSSVSSAQTAFSHYYGNSELDSGKDVVVDSEGNVIVVGSTGSYNDNNDGYYLGLDDEGNIFESTSFGGSGSDWFEAVVPYSGDYIAVGTSNSFNNFDYDFWVVHFAQNGEVINEVAIDAGDWDFARDVVVIESGEIVVVGETYSADFGARDGWIVKLSNDFQVVDELFVGGAYEDQLNAITQLELGQLVAAGALQNAEGNHDHALWWIDENNFEITQELTYGEEEFDDYTNELTVAANGNLYLVGATNNTEGFGGIYDMYFYFVTPTGEFLEERFYGGEDVDGTNCITQLPSGEFVIAGFTYSWGNNAGLYKNAKSYRTSINGWWQSGMNPTLGDNRDEEYFGVAACPDGGYVLAGTKQDEFTEIQYVYVVKILEDNTFVEFPSYIQDANSISEVNILELDLIPEPSGIQITGDPANELNVRLFDLGGKLVHQSQLRGPVNSIDLTTLTHGLYIVDITSSKQEHFRTKISWDR